VKVKVLLVFGADQLRSLLFPRDSATVKPARTRAG